MSRRRKKIWWAILVLPPLPVAWGVQQWRPAPVDPSSSIELLALETRDGMVRLPGGEFAMGSSQAHDEDARPVHPVRIDSFWLDAIPVTNRQFAAFVAATQFVTSAERQGESLVFDRSVGTWLQVTGASWQYPQGPEHSSLAEKEDCPVVQVSWYDAVAYADWAGKRLPTEAEMEYAARGGLSDCPYPWGRELQMAGQHQANYWQGLFPQRDEGADGFRSLAPVAQFLPNRFALYDMAGNAWQWCADWYAEDYYGSSPAENPPGPAAGKFRVRRGGSWLSTAHLRSALRSSHHHSAPPGETTNTTGFRCAKDVP